MSSDENEDRHARKRGIAARQRIVAALLERQDSGQSPFTTEELRTTVGGSLTNLRHHLEWLKNQRVITTRDAVREVARIEVVLIDPAARTRLGSELAVPLECEAQP